MTVKEARAVTVTMEAVQFTPPPRRINDILDVLSQPGAFNPDITRRYNEAADTPVPYTAQPDERAVFLFKRGIAATNVGRSRQARDDLKAVLELSRDGDRHTADLLFRLGNPEAQFGNVDDAIRLTLESLALKPRIRHYEKLVRYHGRKGEFKTVKKYLDAGVALSEKMGRKTRKCKGKRAPCQGQLPVPVVDGQARTFVVAVKGGAHYRSGPFHR